jgi:adenosylhomocysteinase
MKFQIKDISLAKKGLNRINWAAQSMSVLQIIKKELQEKKLLKGLRIGACLHVTTETANLVITLKKAGAQVYLCGSNPLSTQDDVAASLVKHEKISVFAKKGESSKEYYQYLKEVINFEPQIAIDDGADLISSLHKNKKKVLGATEETTTGVNRLKALEKKNKLMFPIIAVNNAYTKYLFDNRYGTGQSTIDGIIRATNRLLAGQNLVVAGYGWCGKGVAMRAKGMGANVIVCEVNPVRALESAMDGFQVMEMKEAAKIGDIFVTTTGDAKVITKKHFLLMKNGAILANSGHFNVEIDVKGLEQISKRKKRVKQYIDEYSFKNGKKIYLLGEGRLINLTAAEGHPAQVMDMSFSNQVLSVLYIYKNHDKLDNIVYNVPPEIDNKIAMLKLKSLGIRIDKLTHLQKKYLTSWEIGT